MVYCLWDKFQESISKSSMGEQVKQMEDGTENKHSYGDSLALVGYRLLEQATTDMRGRTGKLQHMQLSSFLKLCSFLRLPSNANNRLIL